VHSVLITDISETERGWGIVSDRDLLAAASEGKNGRRARDVARSPVVTIGAKETLTRACATLVERGITHLVVTDKARLPVGMLSSLDVVRALATLT
jgi:CBS domain-containing protein